MDRGIAIFTFSCSELLLGLEVSVTLIFLHSCVFLCSCYKLLTKTIDLVLYYRRIPRLDLSVREFNGMQTEDIQQFYTIHDDVLLMVRTCFLLMHLSMP